MELRQDPKNETRSVGHSEVWMPEGALLTVQQIRYQEYIAEANDMVGLAFEERQKMTQKNSAPKSTGEQCRQCKRKWD